MAFLALSRFAKGFSAYSSYSGLQLNKLMNHFDNVDGLARVGANIAGLSASVSFFKGNSAAASKAGGIACTFGAVENFSSMGKAVCLWHNFLTGSLFFEIDDNGRFVKTEDEQKKIRKPLSIVSDISQIVGKTASTIKWFDAMGVGNLGHHANALGGRGVAFGCSVICCSLGLVDSAVNLGASLKEQNVSEKRFAVKMWIMSVLCCIFNIISLPFEYGTIVGISPLTALIGAVFCLFSAFLNLVNSILYDFNCIQLLSSSEPRNAYA
ncbi:hypothetical protein CLAVI_000239 [Candidatus Clavichlamydia salmonicola]|uniref:hypothetical protein n=1 Tax=Candidatus Clavichlamydia salmonicola TaxID=469812 RepID=UPI001891BA02|nr:hypothetical protein [Candidatus Clavichlamydia salmonicola]MBF5050625.1 hypothetical protein [Candidatus Clavichlamydia salmonicola]